MAMRGSMLRANGRHRGRYLAFRRPFRKRAFPLVATPDRFAIEATISNHFAWLNTRQAVERTFMGWLRTAVSLISFGFTIVQFFQRFSQMPDSVARPISPGAPRMLGLALIGTGVLM